MTLLATQKQDFSTPIAPFLRWAGGKRWLTQNYDNLFPSAFNDYYEPFLGGGAVFFHIRPKSGILSDANEELINCYQAIQSNWEKLFFHINRHEQSHCKDYYYMIRSSSFSDPYERAARFLYLNRTCWNGLYRVNRNGGFNVPIGSKRRVLLDTDDFQNVSECLKGMQITHSDFEKVLDSAQRNDFIFIDPPYTVTHNFNGFFEYNEHLFSWDDQIRLKDAIVRAVQREAKVLVLNAYHPLVLELYEGVGEHIQLKRTSLISGRTSGRGAYEELAVKCW
jgi:DNA adenine methylase